MKFRIASCAAAVGVTAALSAVAPSAQAAPSNPPVSADPQHLAKLAGTLEKRLGTHGAGAYLDRSTGKLVVDVTDGSAAQTVRTAGAIPRTVTRSRADLDRVTKALDKSAKVAGSAWGIDPTTNQVVVSVDQSLTGARLAKVESVARRFGSAVRIEHVRGRFSVRSLGYTAGGQAIYTNTPEGQVRCSLGFNVRTGRGGNHFFLTAGHCTNLGADWLGGVNGSTGASVQSFLGTRTGSSFPGNDYGIVQYAGNPGDGLDYPPVGFVHLFNGTAAQDITTAADPVVGQAVTRSGSTTGVHTGTVTALGQTVNYAEGTVTGMIKTNVCAEPGDSGGSLYAGTTALGLTSGGNGDCTFGGTTFFQPVTEALTAYGVSVW